VQRRLNGEQRMAARYLKHPQRLLTRRILSEVPALSERLEAGESYEAATLLLGWAAPRIVWAYDGQSLIRTRGKSASTLLRRYFEPARKGVYCSGAADFLHKLLNLFEINSFVVEFGTTTDFLTHAVVMVTCPAEERRSAFYLLDPTFNMHFTDRDSDAPITVEALLGRERAGRLDSVGVKVGSLAERTVVKRSGRAELERFRCGLGNGASTGCGLETYMTAWAPAFERNGFGIGVAGLLNLLATGDLFRPQRLGVPSSFRRIHAEAAAVRSPRWATSAIQHG